MARAVHAFVSGRVQGVGFRWSVREHARGAGLSGWVRNLRDGRVELVFEGSDEAVVEGIGWLNGPSTPGRVESVTTAELDVAGLSTFETRSTR